MNVNKIFINKRKMTRKLRGLPIKLLISGLQIDLERSKWHQMIASTRTIFYCYMFRLKKTYLLATKIKAMSNWCFSFAPELVGYSAPRDLHRRAAYSICESWFLIHQDVYHDLFVCS